MTPQMRAKEEKKPLHIIFNKTAQKKEDGVIKHQEKARGGIISFMSLISVEITDLKHVIRDSRNSAV